MKITLALFLFVALAVMAGCAPATSSPAEIPASTTPIPATEIPASLPAASPTAISPSFAGTLISYGPLTLVVPFEVANGASEGEIPPVTGADAAWWQKTPGNLEILLGDYYILQGRSRQPRIEVYPAQGYAELVPAAFESMHRLNNILGNPDVPISSEELPVVPFFNEVQAFATNIQVISFQNGQGVRFLSEYGQSATSANNHDLFYQFQGLTSDGEYYIVAIFPINAPGLGDSSDPTAAIPVEGVSFPSMGNPNADWEPYYAAVTHYLDRLPADAFTPTLNQLDALIQSIEIMP